MPPARSATAASRPRSHASQARARTGPRRIAGPRRLVRLPPRARVRWDRVGRVALLLVLAVVAGLYVQHALSYVSARSQLGAQQAIVHRLQRENGQLSQQEKSLRNPATIVLDARKLGMVRPGERPFVMTGVPSQ